MIYPFKYCVTETGRKFFGFCFMKTKTFPFERMGDGVREEEIEKIDI